MLLIWGITIRAEAVPFGGVEFPGGAVSFADTVINYSPGPGAGSPYNIPSNALGIPDYADSSGYVSLGWGGSLTLQFTDNSLTTSGDSGLDLWIFEIGIAIEGTDVSISTNGTDWLSVGNVGGATSGIDIDAYIGSGVVLWEQYSYVMLTDLDWRLSGSPWAGADIDAVGAISSAPPVKPVPEPGTMLLLGSGLAGLIFYRRRNRYVTHG